MDDLEADGLPDFRDELDDDEDQDIQELIKGSKGKDKDIYNKLKHMMNEKDAQYYEEVVDEKGNVHLVNKDEYDEDDEYGE